MGGEEAWCMCVRVGEVCVCVGGSTRINKK